MNLQRAGFWALVAVLLVDFGQVHRLVPGLSLLKPGLIGEVVLFALVLMELPRARWIRNIAIWRLLFLGAIATGLVFAVTQGRALMVLKTELPRYLTAFLGICVFVRRIRDLRVLQNLFIIMAVLIGAYAITHGGHGPGLYKDENDTALVLVMLLPFPFLKLFGETGPRKTLFCLGSFFLILLAIGLTLSRGGMVGCLPALFFCWLKSRNKAIGLALGGLALVGALVLAPKDFTHEFESIADTDQGTAETRRFFWDLSVQMFEKRPVFGVGAMSWGNALYSGLIGVPDRRAHMTPHSIYFQLLSELGLVGIFCFMGLLVSVTRSLRSLTSGNLERDAILFLPDPGDPLAVHRARSDQNFLRYFSASLAIGIIGYLISGAFLSEVFYPGLGIFAALVQATVEARRNELMLAVAMGGGLSRGPAAAGPAPVITDPAIGASGNPGPLAAPAPVAGRA